MQSVSKIKTSSDQAAFQLRNAIISGELKPGDRLREAEISVAMGVSRSPIREAFRILESEGLVQITANKGVSVTHLTENDLSEIYEIRILLELHGLRLALKHMTKKHIDEFKLIIQKMEEQLNFKNYIGYLNVSHEFHEFYMRNCGNERLFKLFRILRNNILAIQVFAYSYPKYSADSIEEHRKILSALEETNLNKAEEYLRMHLEAGYKRAKKYLKKA